MNYDVDPQKWWKLSLWQQIWNIWSEFSRAVKAKKSWNSKRFWWAVGRMIELFQLTLDESNSLTSSQTRELCRVKEVVCDFLCGDNIYKWDEVSLQKYFDRFVPVK